MYKEAQRVIVDQKPLSYYEEHEKDHGRSSSWYVRVFDSFENKVTNEWKQLRKIIHVHKYTVSKGRETHSDRLYISDNHANCAAFYHKGIRGHWTIENSLHWVKDVIHKEDKNQLRNRNGPVNSSVFSSIAINLHRKNGHHSITEGQLRAIADLKMLFSLLDQ